MQPAVGHRASRRGPTPSRPRSTPWAATRTSDHRRPRPRPSWSAPIRPRWTRSRWHQYRRPTGRRRPWSSPRPSAPSNGVAIPDGAHRRCDAGIHDAVHDPAHFWDRDVQPSVRHGAARGDLHDVTATFNAAAVDPNFTTATATTTVTINPRVGRDRWASVSTTGTLTCVYTNPTAVTCTATGVGNKGYLPGQCAAREGQPHPLHQPDRSGHHRDPDDDRWRRDDDRLRLDGHRPSPPRRPRAPTHSP